LQIVFDDTPPPVDRPLEVMAPRPAAAGQPVPLPAAPPPGLTRVDAPAARPLALPAGPVPLPERPARPVAAPPAIAAVSKPPSAAPHAPDLRLGALIASAEAALVRIAHARPSAAPAEEVAAAEPPKPPS